MLNAPRNVKVVASKFLLWTATNFFAIDSIFCRFTVSFPTVTLFTPRFIAAMALYRSSIARVAARHITKKL